MVRFYTGMLGLAEEGKGYVHSKEQEDSGSHSPYASGNADEMHRDV